MLLGAWGSSSGGPETPEVILNHGPDFFVLWWKQCKAPCRFSRVRGKLFETAEQDTATTPRANVWLWAAASEEEYWELISAQEKSGKPVYRTSGCARARGGGGQESIR